MAFWTALFGKTKVTNETPPALDRVRLQVYSTNYFGVRAIEQTKSPMAIRPLAPGLVTALVEDLGGAERMLAWDLVDAFGTSRDEMFALAQRQGAASETAVHSEVIENTVEVLVSNGFFLSAFMLERLATREPKQGALFVPLSWHHWCVHIIGAMSVPPVVPFLHAVAGQIGDTIQVTDAETLVRDVYWYRPDRTIEKLANQAPSAELARLLAS